MMGPLNRPAPLMDAAAYKTYEMRSPLSTHFRPATCAEVDCPHYLKGWQVRLDNLTPDLQEAARKATYRKHGRDVRYQFTEHSLSDTEHYLVFAPGQPCFKASQHRKRLERPPLYIVRDGDYRGNPRGTKARLHQNPANWVEDFATHQQAIADEIEKG